LVRQKSWLLAAGVVVLVLFSFVVRAERERVTIDEDGIFFWDADTVRRLVRLNHLADPTKPYPYNNLMDGYPEGSVVHWTLPMDGVIFALDPLLSWNFPGARRYEAGALWAGPVLGALSVFAFTLLAMRWLGRFTGLFTGFLYSVAIPPFTNASLGNGDHQSLQHLCLVIALLGFLCLLAQRAGPGLSVLCGASLGMALWVSTESQLALFLMGLGAVVSLVMTPVDRRPLWGRIHATWALAALAVCLLADRLEHPGEWITFEWDKISGFQIYPIALFLLFLALLQLCDRRLPFQGGRALAVALGSSLALGVLPFLVLPSASAAFSEQWTVAREANRWAQNAVQEYTPLLRAYDTWVLNRAELYLGILSWAVPLWLPAFLMQRRWPASVRWVSSMLLVGLLGFMLAEAKLAHLFVVLFCPALVLGLQAWSRLAERWSSGQIPRRVLQPLFLASFAGIALWQAPWSGGKAPQDIVAARHLVSFLRDVQPPNGRSDPEMRSFLASWDLGAHILYYADRPVVASGYHRNLAGTHDSYRALLSTSWTELEPVVRRRRVRWIVTSLKGLGEAFLKVHEILPSLGQFAEPRLVPVEGGHLLHKNFLPRFSTTLFYVLHHAAPRGDERFEEIYVSPYVRSFPDRSGKALEVPEYRVFLLHYPEEFGAHAP
jgi:hypothetical protein